MLDLRPGDKIKITNSEFPSWNPTCATVIKLYIKFPDSKPPYRQQWIGIRLDEHPFSEQLWFDPMRDLSFAAEDPNFHIERLCDEQI